MACSSRSARSSTLWHCREPQLLGREQFQGKAGQMAFARAGAAGRPGRGWRMEGDHDQAAVLRDAEQAVEAAMGW